MNNFAVLLGRFGLALIFILSGWSKIAGYAGTQQYMEAMGVPGALLPLVILVELGGGLAILGGSPPAGSRWRWPASRWSPPCCSMPIWATRTSSSIS